MSARIEASEPVALPDLIATSGWAEGLVQTAAMKLKAEAVREPAEQKVLAISVRPAVRAIWELSGVPGPKHRLKVLIAGSEMSGEDIRKLSMP